jgi:hypothetical protein
VIPWIIFAVVVVPLVVVAFAVTRRKSSAAMDAMDEPGESRARTDREFSEAEAYEATWHEEDKERYHQERLP